MYQLKVFPFGQKLHSCTFSTLSLYEQKAGYSNKMLSGIYGSSKSSFLVYLIPGICVDRSATWVMSVRDTKVLKGLLNHWTYSGSPLAKILILSRLSLNLINNTLLDFFVFNVTFNSIS